MLQVSLISVTYAVCMRSLALVPLLLLAACNSDIYTRDGVTDGDTFYLAPRAYSDDDPVLQSWVAYSLAKSVCQIDVGGEIPARVSNYGCEFTARRHLVEAWLEQRLEDDTISDAYLDDLVRVSEAGFLDEYTVSYFGRRNWQVPAEVRVDDFETWQRRHLRRHRPQTRIIGSWGYYQR